MPEIFLALIGSLEAQKSISIIYISYIILSIYFNPVSDSTLSQSSVGSFNIAAPRFKSFRMKIGWVECIFAVGPGVFRIQILFKYIIDHYYYFIIIDNFNFEKCPNFDQFE